MKQNKKATTELILPFIALLGIFSFALIPLSFQHGENIDEKIETQFLTELNDTSYYNNYLKEDVMIQRDGKFQCNGYNNLTLCAKVYFNPLSGITIKYFYFNEHKELFAYVYDQTLIGKSEHCINKNNFTHEMFNFSC